MSHETAIPEAASDLAGRAISDLLATALSSEAQLWGAAKDHDHLQSMWETRITKETNNLTDAQAKAVAIAQACAYALAVQMLTVRIMGEVGSMAKLYMEIKSS